MSNFPNISSINTNEYTLFADLPHPEGPNKETNSLDSIWNVTSDKAFGTTKCVVHSAECDGEGLVANYPS